MNIPIHATAALCRIQGQRPSRRQVLSLLGGMLGIAALDADLSQARNRKRKSGKKIPLCVDGQTVMTSGSGKNKNKKLKSLLEQGATRGECAPSLPPGGGPGGGGDQPRGCTPVCEAGRCGGNDGCGGTCRCPAGSICHDGACQACTVSCGAESVDCGLALQIALQLGGTIRVCPGRYTGSFEIVAQNAVVIGAGDGADPARDTILDGNKSDRTLVVGPGRIAELHRLRITGGKTSNEGGGVLNDGTLTMTRCTVIQNEAALDGGGICHLARATGSLTVNDCTVEKNKGGAGGGFAAHSPRACTVNDSLITGNKSMSNGGGAMASGAFEVNRSTFRGNDAVDGGGGLYTSATAEINEGSAFTNNTATFGGGGIYIQTGPCTLKGVTVTGNTSFSAPGGGIFRNTGAATLVDCFVSQNEQDNCAGITC